MSITYIKNVELYTSKGSIKAPYFESDVSIIGSSTSPTITNKLSIPVDYPAWVSKAYNSTSIKNAFNHTRIDLNEGATAYLKSESGDSFFLYNRSNTLLARVTNGMDSSNIGYAEVIGVVHDANDKYSLVGVVFAYNYYGETTGSASVVNPTNTSFGYIVWDGFDSSAKYFTQMVTDTTSVNLLTTGIDYEDAGYAVTYDLSGCTGEGTNPTIIVPNATITNFQFNLDSGYAFNSGSCWIDGDGFPSGTPIEFNFNIETGSLIVGPISSDITIHVHSYIDPYNDPNNPDLIDGESDIPGGDSISVPSLPGIGAVSSGMIGLFNPSASQMQLLADYMWTDFGGTGSTTEDILKEIVQAIKRAISNPLDYVIGLNIIPSQGLSVGSSTSVRFGFTNSNVSMPRLTSQYFVVDCGSLSFDKICGDTFLDYAPYSKFSLYLPYIGVKEMDANDFVGHTISILYHGDVVTGGVTAYILKDGSVMYQYSGCCALTVPLNADSWGTTISGAIQIATAIIGGATLSSAGKGFAAKRAGVMAATGAANIASNPSLLSPQVMRSGAISGGAGCMASQKPFVIREAVRFHTTEGFNTISGYPSYYYKELSSMHGFTSVLDVHLHGIPGTHQELAEIEDLLKEGVIL